MTTLPAKRQNAPQESQGIALVRGASERLKAALPAHYTTDKLAQVMGVIALRSPRILGCNPESIITSLITAATLDLDLTPGLNEGFLVPRYNKDIRAEECQFQPGYKGLEKLAVRTGAVRYIQPREVYSADEFKVWHQDERTHYIHTQSMVSDRGRVTHYYAVAKMADGLPLIEVMTADEVEEIHKRSESYRTAQRKQCEEYGPWSTDYNAMARKTVIRKLCKSLPRVASDPVGAAAYERLNAAIEADNVQYEGHQLEAPKVDNASGFGQGMYASPEQSAAFEAKLKGFLAEINDKWLNSLSEVCRGDIPKSVRELNEYQADGHLLKWAVETGRLDRAIVPEDAKVRQRYRYTAVVYHRSKQDQGALGRELRAYAEQHWLRQIEALGRDRPELLPALVERYGIDGPTPVVTDDDPDPETDFDATPTDEDKWASK